MCIVILWIRIEQQILNFINRILVNNNILSQISNYLMGKRRIDKIKMIENNNHRKVTYCKRKKGLLKKSIELSILCDVSMFLFVFDKS